MIIYAKKIDQVGENSEDSKKPIDFQDLFDLLP
jgi:hypothetical protein